MTTVRLSTTIQRCIASSTTSTSTSASLYNLHSSLSLSSSSISNFTSLSSSTSTAIPFLFSSSFTLVSKRTFASKAKYKNPSNAKRVKDEYTETVATDAPLSDYHFYTNDPFHAFQQRGKAIVPSKVPGVPALPPPFYSTAIRAQSVSRMKTIRISPKKLNDMCRLVRGLGVEEAVIQMKYFGKLRAKYIATCISRATKTAVDQYNMDRSRLYVAQAIVNRNSRCGYRMDYKSRGRFGIIKHQYSNLIIIVREQPLMIPAESGKVPSITGQKNRYWGASHTGGVEVRIGRYGRKLTTIERTSRMMAEYKAAKRRMGLDKEPLPLPSRKAEMNFA